MNKDFCYFYSRYNLPDEDDIMCNYKKDFVSRIVCEKCPYYISEKVVERKIRRYVLEREANK